jgi:hypothetical protein
MRLDEWRHRQQSKEEARDSDRIRVMHFDATTGRVSTSGPIDPSGPLEQPVVDLDDFFRRGETSILTSWRPGDGHSYRVFRSVMC